MTALVLSLREGLEAALIVGILLGVLKQLGRPQLGRAVWAGVISAVIVSLLAATGLILAGIELEGRAEEIFEDVTLLLAATFLTGMIFWMHRQGARFRATLEARAAQAAGPATASGRWALFAVAFLAVLREGLELALLLVATSLQSPALDTLLGAVLGLAGAVLLGVLIYRGVLRLNLRFFFSVTNMILLFFAAGMVGLGVHELIEGGVLPAIVAPVYNINAFLSDKSAVGELLKSLFGYNGNPALIETLAYLGYLATVGWLILRPRRRPVAPGQMAAH
ncbi:MAG: iron transporter [Chloroflexi bacterium]|nr:iron transporter [Chloroflexota bacterium]